MSAALLRSARVASSVLHPQGPVETAGCECDQLNTRFVHMKHLLYTLSSVLGRMQMGVTNGHRNPSLKDFQRTVLIRICTDWGEGTPRRVGKPLVGGRQVRDSFLNSWAQ